jgi:predicted hotdog family 3-hydroxylacyl-ACP dehydratase
MQGVPEISDILPHAEPMILLDEIIHSESEFIVCAVRVREDNLFSQNGAVPSWLGIEYMAQTVAAFSGLENWRQGHSIKVGFLLGTRSFNTDTADFAVGQRLEVRAERWVHGSNGMAAFNCSVQGEAVNQHATLSVYEPSVSALQSMISGE